MGARWPWCAICEDGHLTSGFSGGADAECGHSLKEDFSEWCGKPILDEHNCWDGGSDYCSTKARERLLLSWREFDNDRRQMKIPFCEEEQ